MYGNSGNRFEKINTRMNFQYALPCLVWCLLASCVVIFPIRCDLGDFLCLEFPPLRLLAENRDKWNQLKSQRIGKITTQEARRHQVKQGKACFSVFHWKFMRVWINCTTLILSSGRLCFYMHFNNYFVERIREDMRWRGGGGGGGGGAGHHVIIE